VAEACKDAGVALTLVVDISGSLDGRPDYTDISAAIRQAVDAGAYIELAAADNLEIGTENSIRDRVNKLKEFSPEGVIFPLWFFAADSMTDVLESWKLMEATPDGKTIRELMTELKSSFTPKTPAQLKDVALKTMIKLPKDVMPEYSDAYFARLANISALCGSNKFEEARAEIRLFADEIKNESGAVSRYLNKAADSEQFAPRIEGAVQGLAQKMLYDEYIRSNKRTNFANPNDELLFAGWLLAGKLSGNEYAVALLSSDKSRLSLEEYKINKEKIGAGNEKIIAVFLQDALEVTAEEKNIELNVAIAGLEAAQKDGSDPLAISKMLRLFDILSDKRNDIDAKKIRDAAVVTNIDTVFDLKAAG
jgi:hypothetical protein